MAKKNKDEKALSALIPSAFQVQIPDGKIVTVAGNQDENRILNYILAGQVRQIIEKNLKMYADLEKPLTPKEMKEMADAARSLAEFSAEVYKGPEVTPQDERKAEALPVVATDFSQLTKKDEDRGSEGSPQSAGSGEVAGSG